MVDNTQLTSSTSTPSPPPQRRPENQPENEERIIALKKWAKEYQLRNQSKITLKRAEQNTMNAIQTLFEFASHFIVV